MLGRLATTSSRSRRPPAGGVRIWLTAAVVALFAAAAVPPAPLGAQATITFEALAGLDPANGINYVTNCYFEAGVRVSVPGLPCGESPAAAFGVYAPTEILGYTGSAALFNNLTSTVAFTPVSGAPFSLGSIDLAPILLGPRDVNPLDVMVTGSLAGGGTVTQMLTVPAGATGLTTFTLGGFTGLSSAQFTVTSPGFEPFVQFDNVRVSVVPEPASVTLLGSGLLALAGYVRRRGGGRAS